MYQPSWHTTRLPIAARASSDEPQSLVADPGEHSAARTLLADIYDWFTEGFDTTDVQETKALLAGLGSSGAARTLDNRWRGWFWGLWAVSVLSTAGSALPVAAWVPVGWGLGLFWAGVLRWQSARE